MYNIHGSHIAVGICFNIGSTLNLVLEEETFSPLLFCWVICTVSFDVTGKLNSGICIGFMNVFGPLYVRVVGSPLGIT